MSTLVRPDGIFVPPPLILPREERRQHLFMHIAALIDPDGSVVQQDREWVPNALHDAGETSMLSVYLRELANVTKFLALVNDSAADTETKGTMAATTETVAPGSNGYARQQVLATDWVDEGIVSGDARMSAAEKTFGPVTGTALTATHSALTTTASTTAGLLLATIALSATTTIAVGQSFKIIFRWTQQ